MTKQVAEEQKQQYSIFFFFSYLFFFLKEQPCIKRKTKVWKEEKHCKKSSPSDFKYYVF